MSVITGDAFPNTLTGTAGADTIDGGSGADLMIGGLGDDTYYVDQATDSVKELVGQGYDTVIASATWALEAGSEVERIIAASGTTAINLTGNEFAQELDGNGGNNLVDGGLGADTMIGGRGNDTYLVDNPGDVVVENANEGSDTIKTTLGNYALGANVENLTYTGTGAFVGVGNGLANVLSAYTTGVTLTGGAGDDIYQIGKSDAKIVELAGGGRDTVVATANFVLPSNVEVLKLYGTSTGGWLTGIGNELDNSIIGDANPDVIVGGAGNDTLSGGAGKDTFVFAAGSGHDTITDYTSADHVRLGHEYGFFTYQQVSKALAQVGSNVVLTLSPTDDVTFLNTTLSQFSAANFELPLDRSALTLAFYDEFDNLSTYNPYTGQGVWMTQYGFANATGATAHTLPYTGEREIYVDPSYAGTGATPLGLNPFSAHDSVIDISIANTPAPYQNLLYNRAYTSGVLTTQPTFAQTYGYFEVRAKLPTGAGAWPAFWLIPSAGSIPPEIDILEAHGTAPDVNVETIHDVAYSGGVNGVYTYSPGLNTGMHTYGFLWSPQYLTWYLDGLQVAQVATPADMNQSMYMVLNLAVDSFGAISPTSLPTPFTIDYVRAYATADTIPGSPGSRVFGTSGVDTLVGGPGDDTLAGGLGNDVIDGRGGNNIAVYSGVHTRYIVTYDAASGGYWVTDTIVGSLNEGRDHLVNVQTLTFTDGSFSIQSLLPEQSVIQGTNGADTLTGSALDDTFAGLGGGDSIDGGGGINTVVYAGPSSRYVIYQDSAGGYDVADTTVPGGPMDRLTNVNAIRFSDQTVDPSTVTAQLLRGTAGGDTLTGGSGNDLFIGLGGGDVLNGLGGVNTASYAGKLSDYTIYADGTGGAWVQTNSAGSSLSLFDRLFSIQSLQVSDGVFATSAVTGGQLFKAGSGTVTLTGGSGNDALVGGGGTDTLIGGAGNDVYYVDNVQDIVRENAGQGFDVVYTSAPWTVTAGASIEKVVLTGTANANLTGNAFAMELDGNSGINTLSDGGGADLLKGGLGNDTYVVTNAGTVVVENAGEGTDTIKTTLHSYVLPDNVENLTFTGTGNFYGVGNATAGTITGGAGDDTLVSGTGVEKLVGGGGNDTFYVNNVNDIVVAGAGGNSAIYASVSGILAAANVSKLVYTGTGNFTGYANATGTTIVSGAGNDTLTGAGGNDVLDAGTGNNTLTGNAGADVFVFAAPGQGVNRITDFVSGADHIQLSASGFNFDSSTAFTFVSGSSPISTDAHPTVLYNTTTGNLYFDPTGADNHDLV
ncbi:MAG: glycosyl hydrolase family protein, partial [Bradyrhizobiaceae bacterium]